MSVVICGYHWKVEELSIIETRLRWCEKMLLFLIEDGGVYMFKCSIKL
jgi:hypothetical protein